MNFTDQEKEFISHLIGIRTSHPDKADYVSPYTAKKDEVFTHSQMINLNQRIYKSKKKNLYVIREVLSNYYSGQVLIIAEEYFWKTQCRSLFTVAMIQDNINDTFFPSLEDINKSVNHYLEQYDKAIEGGHYEVIPVSDDEKERVVSYVWGAG
jgi:hypothetical protein